MSRVFRASAAAMAAAMATVKAAPAATKVAGIQKPFAVTPALSKFHGGAPEASRTEVVKNNWDHMKLNNLQNPANKREIRSDDKLKTIFAGKDDVGMMGRHLIRKSVFVHFLLRKKKIFVTVTDFKGNKKTGASAGSLVQRKGRSRRSRYAAEATAEHVGQSVRKMGFKSAVMIVKGYTFFRKKQKAILSWREGFMGERRAQRSPIMYIQDVTQLPHNGCRLPKKRRV